MSALQQMLMGGAGGGPFEFLRAHAITDTVVFVKGDATATASIEFQLDLDLVDTPLGGASPGIDATREWAVAGTTASDYDIRVTVTAGSTPTGALTATWLNLGTTRFWSISRTYSVSGVGTTTSTFTVEIRRVSDSVVVHTSTGWNLSATIA